ncbi:hypothetical protein [Acinetobacter sp. ANC 5502]
MSHYSTLKGLGRAIAYFPQLGIHLGNPLAGIFLSQLVYWHDKTDCDLGVYKTSEEWQKETGLTYSHQKTARKLLKDLDILTETEKRLEHKLYFKLNIEAFDAWFEKCINFDQNSEHETASSRTRNPSFGDKQKPYSGTKESFNRGEAESTSVIHNITTENTTEITSIDSRVAQTKKSAKFDFKSALIENGVSEKTATEFMQVRKAKGAVNTQRAFGLLKNQIEKAQLNFVQAIDYCLDRQKPWGAFEAQWYFNEQNRTAQPQQQAQPYQRRFGNTQQAPAMRDIVGECQ